MRKKESNDWCPNVSKNKIKSDNPKERDNLTSSSGVVSH